MSVAAATIYKVSLNIILYSRFYLTKNHNAFPKFKAFRRVNVYLPLYSYEHLEVSNYLHF